MKSFCCVVAIAVCLGFAGVAHASSIDFAINILDPTGTGATGEISNTFPISFAACTSFQINPLGPTTTDDCFVGINETGPLTSTPLEYWNSLTVTIDDPSNLLGLNNANCGTQSGIDTADSIFGSSSCTESGGVYTLSFTDGIIGPGDIFVIAVSDPNLASYPNGVFPSGEATVTESPEPNSLVLLASGTVMFGLLLYAERRRRTRQSLSC